MATHPMTGPMTIPLEHALHDFPATEQHKFYLQATFNFDEPSLCHYDSLLNKGRAILQLEKLKH